MWTVCASSNNGLNKFCSIKNNVEHTQLLLVLESKIYEHFNIWVMKYKPIYNMKYTSLHTQTYLGHLTTTVYRLLWTLTLCSNTQLLMAQGMDYEQ